MAADDLHEGTSALLDDLERRATDACLSGNEIASDSLWERAPTRRGAASAAAAICHALSSRFGSTKLDLDARESDAAAEALASIAQRADGVGRSSPVDPSEQPVAPRNSIAPIDPESSGGG